MEELENIKKAYDEFVKSAEEFIDSIRRVNDRKQDSITKIYRQHRR